MLPTQIYYYLTFVLLYAKAALGPYIPMLKCFEQDSQDVNFSKAGTRNCGIQRSGAIHKVHRSKSGASNSQNPVSYLQRGTGSQNLSVASRDHCTPLDCLPLFSDRKNRWTFRLRNADVSAVQNYYGGLPI